MWIQNKQAFIKAVEVRGEMQKLSATRWVWRGFSCWGWLRWLWPVGGFLYSFCILAFKSVIPLLTETELWEDLGSSIYWFWAACAGPALSLVFHSWSGIVWTDLFTSFAHLSRKEGADFLQPVVLPAWKVKNLLGPAALALCGISAYADHQPSGWYKVWNVGTLCLEVPQGKAEKNFGVMAA